MGSPKGKRVEFRAPDPTANPYLAFAAIMMAGLDGIQNKIVPPRPVDKDLYELEPEDKKNVAQTPGTLSEALAALRPITSSCSKAMSSRPTSSRHLDYKQVREVEGVRFARIRMSSSLLRLLESSGL